MRPSRSNASSASAPGRSHGPALPVRRRPGEGGSKRSASHGPVLSKRSASNGPVLSKRSASNGFTIVEVMMASVILVVGFMGMIQAITIGSEMLATARRQTLATQILNHEMEKLRMVGWSTTTTVGGTTFTGGIAALADSSAATYDSDLQAIDDAITASGVTFTLERDVTAVTTDLVEVVLTVKWTKGGTTTAAVTPTGSWLDKIAFYRESPIAREYTRRSVSWFTKYGLNHAAQRS